MNDFIDDFIVDTDDIISNPEWDDLYAAVHPQDIKQRHDIFHGGYRDECDMHVTGLLFTWEPPQHLIYDWYRTESGWTVSLEAPASLSRPRSVPITIRVRHEKEEREPTIHKLGRTVTFDDRDPDLLERARREIINAFCEGESPLWRLRQELGLPSFIVDALSEPFDQKSRVKHLDLEPTKSLLLVGLLDKEHLLKAMHIRPSTYTRRIP